MVMCVRNVLYVCGWFKTFFFGLSVGFDSLVALASGANFFLLVGVTGKAAP